MNQLVVATTQGLFVDGTPEPLFEGRDVRALDPSGSWALVDHGEVWHRKSSWGRVATHPDLRLECLLMVGDALLVGASDATLLKLRDADFENVDAFADTEGSDEWFTPWGGPPAVRSLAASRDGSVFVNVHVGGIVRGDGDALWEPTLDIGADVHEVRVDARRNLIVAACAVGFAESGDRGFAWSYDSEDLHATYARAVALCDEHVLMSVSRGPRGGDAAIYRQAIDGTESFERCRDGLPESFTDNIDTGCLDADGSDAVFGTSDGDVFRSQDAGATWENTASGLPPIQHVVLLESER